MDLFNVLTSIITTLLMFGVTVVLHVLGKTVQEKRDLESKVEYLEREIGRLDEQLYGDTVERDPDFEFDGF